jgi:hypothetical protein
LWYLSGASAVKIHAGMRRSEDELIGVERAGRNGFEGKIARYWDSRVAAYGCSNPGALPYNL